MYKVIERYRDGAQLIPEYVNSEFQTIEEVRAFVNHAIPKSQAHDWVVVGHGRTVPASHYIEEE